MPLTHFKRYRMEASSRRLLNFAAIPEGFFFVPWDEDLIDEHADVHYRAFSEEMDAQLFPSFRDLLGCKYLLRDLCGRPEFFAPATWLIACGDGFCASIQTGTDRPGVGIIHNVGVAPEYRGLGLGKCLVTQALQSFQQARVGRVVLEVTAENDPAVRLYQRLGFRKMKTFWRALND